MGGCAGSGRRLSDSDGEYSVLALRECQPLLQLLSPGRTLWGHRAPENGVGVMPSYSHPPGEETASESRPALLDRQGVDWRRNGMGFW